MCLSIQTLFFITTDKTVRSDSPGRTFFEVERSFTGDNHFVQPGVNIASKGAIAPVLAH